MLTVKARVDRGRSRVARSCERTLYAVHVRVHRFSVGPPKPWGCCGGHRSWASAKKKRRTRLTVSRPLRRRPTPTGPIQQSLIPCTFRFAAVPLAESLPRCQPASAAPPPAACKLRTTCSRPGPEPPDQTHIAGSQTSRASQQQPAVEDLCCGTGLYSSQSELLTRRLSIDIDYGAPVARGAVTATVVVAFAAAGAAGRWLYIAARRVQQRSRLRTRTRTTRASRKRTRTPCRVNWPPARP